jgi:hypothetical protein
VLSDIGLTERQKTVLLDIYSSFRREVADAAEITEPSAEARTPPTRRRLSRLYHLPNAVPATHWGRRHCPAAVCRVASGDAVTGWPIQRCGIQR